MSVFKVRLFQLALPDNDDAPSFRLQLTPHLLIPLLVPGNLGHPELRVGFWDCIILTAFVAMPEAAMYKDNCPILWQYDIWPPREALIVNPVAKTLTP